MLSSFFFFSVVTFSTSPPSFRYFRLQFMAETYKAKDIISIRDVDFDPELQKLKYQLLLDNNKSKWAKAVDIDDEFLNSAAYKKLMKNIPGLPKQLASHKKLLNFMQSAFPDDEEIFFYINHNVDHISDTQVVYRDLVMKPEYVTGIPLNFIVNDILEYYSSGRRVIDPSLIPSMDQVKTCTFVT